MVNLEEDDGKLKFHEMRRIKKFRLNFKVQQSFDFELLKYFRLYSPFTGDILTGSGVKINVDKLKNFKFRKKRRNKSDGIRILRNNIQFLLINQ